MTYQCPRLALAGSRPAPIGVWLARYWATLSLRVAAAEERKREVEEMRTNGGYLSPDLRGVS